MEKVEIDEMPLNVRQLELHTNAESSPFIIAGPSDAFLAWFEDDFHDNITYAVDVPLTGTFSFRGKKQAR
jgi:hypothetical protein